MRQALANAFVNNFNDPVRLTAVLEDVGRVRAFIRQTTGRPWPLALAAGGVGIGIAQVRQRFGLPPGHPEDARHGSTWSRRWLRDGHSRTAWYCPLGVTMTWAWSGTFSA
ncbi:hypothetical protein [Sorangium sp. So ce388]|uniref:hypothetical protein n=1 Tax=Sorangium sp. So ce388 TaxID=3133309 RepID=UPI003F5CAE62